MNRAACTLMAAIAACTPSAPRSEQGRVVDASAPQAISAAPPAPLIAAKPLLRVIAREGHVTGAAIDRVPAADELVRVGADGRLELALGDHARLTVQGPATLQLSPGGAPALLLREGVLTVDCAAPVQAASVLALWVATPAARLEVAERARFVLWAGTHASVLSIASGNVRARQASTASDLPAGSTSCLSTRARWSHAALTGKLEARAAKIATLPPCARVVSEPTTALLADELAERLGALDEAQQRTRTTLATHARLSTSDPRAAASQQRQLAQQAATSMRLADEVRARTSVLAARTLGDTPAPVAAILTRAARAAP